ncbi:MAG: tetratricopeptide repeat protein, partial [Gammaproteobacteria bacterium]|nr:tetratricopeptide repeat protein [Gammaproteobacteria bacterium]
ALDPGLAAAHAHYAGALVQIGKPREAIAEVRRAVRLEPYNPRRYYGLGYTLTETGHFEQAIPPLEQAVRLAPSASFSRMGLAQPLIALRRYAAARENLRLALAARPDDVFSATELARVYWLGWGDLDSARAVLKAITGVHELNPVLINTWYRQYYLARDYKAARRFIEQATDIIRADGSQSRDFYIARLDRAEHHREAALAGFEKARQWVERKLKNTSASDHLRRAQLLAMRAEILTGLGKGAEAIASARQASRTMTYEANALGGPHFLLALAKIYAANEKPDAAIKLLRRMLEKPMGTAISVALIRLDPAWDPIREDPQLIALLKSHAPRSDPDVLASTAGTL